MWKPCFFVAVVAFLCFGERASGFGQYAHLAASRVAETHLDPAVRRTIERLLAAAEGAVEAAYARQSRAHRETLMPLTEGQSLFVRASLYADLVKTPTTGPWHYVNVPLSESAYDDKWDPEGVHVVRRIEALAKRVFNPAVSDEKRGKSLIYLIHLVEDLHMPLHVCDNQDRGGNQLQIRYQPPGRAISVATNLHSLWDTDMLVGSVENFEGACKLVAALDTDENSKRWASGSPREWANESLALAKRAYIDPITGKMIEQDAVLSDRYTREFLPLKLERCCQSGVRLAHLLNTGLTEQ